MNNLEMEAVKRVASLPYDWSRFNNKVLLISGGTGFYRVILDRSFALSHKLFRKHN